MEILSTLPTLIDALNQLPGLKACDPFIDPDSIEEDTKRIVLQLEYPEADRMELVKQIDLVYQGLERQDLVVTIMMEWSVFARGSFQFFSEDIKEITRCIETVAAMLKPVS